ncbi:MAG: hypothetical protein EXS32_05565 [Opitutus sp.]|nr:hypothetical protein [Opitutus sp.]
MITCAGIGGRCIGGGWAALVLAGVACSIEVAAAVQTLLLVDDHEILYRPGTKRVLQQVKRHPQAVIVPDKPWEGQIAYCSVHRDPATGRFQLWYQGYGGGGGGKICYAESADGLRWIKPEFDLHPHAKGAKTNIVLPGGSNSYSAAVVFDPRDPDPARRYKMAKWEMPNGYVAPWPGLYVAFSPDGIRWTRYARPDSPPPIPRGNYDLAQLPLVHGDYGRKGDPPFQNDPEDKTGSPLSVSDVIDVAYDPPRELFMIFAKTWIDGPNGQSWKRAVVRTDSKDFIHWSKPQLALAPDEHDGITPGAYGGSRTGVQLHGGPAFFHKGIYFCLLQVVDYERTGGMPVELAISRDGYNWSRPFRGDWFIPITHGRDFDGGWIMSNATPVMLSDEIRFYYGGYETPWNAYAPGYKFTGVGLGTLPMDRFAAIRPLDRIGQVTFKPRDLRAFSSLTLNADASRGAIRVEVLDDGYRIPGFTKADSIPIESDSLRHRVAWKGRTLRDLPPGRHMLRVHLENAELFALTLE